jgi:hypothetical protein
MASKSTLQNYFAPRRTLRTLGGKSSFAEEFHLSSSVSIVVKL